MQGTLKQVICCRFRSQFIFWKHTVMPKDQYFSMRSVNQIMSTVKETNWLFCPIFGWMVASDYWQSNFSHSRSFFFPLFEMYVHRGCIDMVSILRSRSAISGKIFQLYFFHIAYEQQLSFILLNIFARKLKRMEDTLKLQTFLLGAHIQNEVRVFQNL